MAAAAAAPEEVVTVVKRFDNALPDHRNVAVICTGGTLCMRPNADGALEPVAGFLAERMLAMPETLRPEMPSCTLYEQLPLLDSSDMGPADWVRIAETIERLYYEYDGFVVIIGTDTMAYAASALSFMLESLGKPVILTGSMLPLSVLFNDAHRNLIVSIVMAATLDVPEVAIFMDSQLMRGNRTVKSNSSGLDAFESPNFPALAKLETGIRFRPALVAPHPKGRFRVQKRLETNIAVWRMIPGFDDEYVRMAVSHCTSLRAIVLELYGTGNVSARKVSLIAALEMAVSRGIIIVATSQCLRGAVNLTSYALGHRLASIGVISAYDMTTEAVVAKLAYLLAWPGMTRALLAQQMGRSLRGDVTESLAANEPANTTPSLSASARPLSTGYGRAPGPPAGSGIDVAQASLSAPVAMSHLLASPPGAAARGIASALSPLVAAELAGTWRPSSIATGGGAAESAAASGGRGAGGAVAVGGGAGVGDGEFAAAASAGVWEKEEDSVASLMRQSAGGFGGGDDERRIMVSHLSPRGGLAHVGGGVFGGGSLAESARSSGRTSNTGGMAASGTGGALRFAAHPSPASSAAAAALPASPAPAPKPAGAAAAVARDSADSLAKTIQQLSLALQAQQAQSATSSPLPPATRLAAAAAAGTASPEAATVAVAVAVSSQ